MPTQIQLPQNFQTLVTAVSTNGTFNVLPFTCFLAALNVIVVANGTNWGLKIQDGSGNAIFADPSPLALGNVYQLLPSVVYMQNGVSIVTSGTTPGTAYVWLNYAKPGALV